MYEANSKFLENGKVQQFQIVNDSGPVTYSEVLKLWQGDESFRAFFIELLANAPFAAYRWETPPVTIATVDRPFEFVLLDCPGLDRTPDPTAFAQHFTAANAKDVIAFPNLGKDAVLVAPCQRGPLSAYGHLAAFTRDAPESQKHALWSLVGKTMEDQLGDQKLWLSTAGMGVSWLHVRLDSQPKYYGFREYKEISK